MRFPIFLLAVTGALYLTGCSQLVSLNPFVTEEQARLDPALLGIWQSSEDESLFIVKAAGNHYAIAYVDESASTIRFEAWLLEAGDAKLLDLVRVDDDPFRIASHIPVRVWLDGASVRFCFLDSDWLRRQAAAQLPSQLREDRTLISAATDALRSFVINYATDARACGEAHVVHRFH